MRSDNNTVVSGDKAAGSRVQNEGDSSELVLRTASDMDNPGILRVLRSSPRTELVVASTPEQGIAGPSQSRVQARPGQTGSSGQDSEGSACAVGGGSPGRGGLRQSGSQDRLVTGDSVLSGDISVQSDAVPVGPRQDIGQAAEVTLPVLRRCNHVKTQVTPYQAGDSSMG